MHRVQRGISRWLAESLSWCIRVFVLAAGVLAFTTASVHALEPLDEPQHSIIGTVQQLAGNSGSWSANGETWSSHATAAKATSTYRVYYTMYGYGPESSRLEEPNYDFHARLVNRSGASETRVGLVYGYQDEGNYNEVVFSPARIAEIRRVTNGVVAVLGSTTYSEGGQNRWLDVRLVQRQERTSVVVNGNYVLRDVISPQSTGQLGFVTYNTAGDFIAKGLSVPSGEQPWKEDFQDNAAQGWPAIDANNWVIENGVLRNFTVAQTNRVHLPVYSDPYPPGGSLRARLRSPYGAAGNLVGVFFGYNQLYGTYWEVVFSRTGVARINRVDQNGATTTLATAAIPTLPNDWFEVTLDVSYSVSVRLDGRPVFTGVPVDSSYSYPEGQLGLITHWSPGQFDNVEFDYSFPSSQNYTFSAAPAGASVIAGSWSTTGGAFNSTANGAQDIALLGPSPSRSTAPYAAMDFSYRARLLNQSSAAAASVGLITHYSAPGEFYEILFTNAGGLVVNKRVQGTVVQQASTTHGIAPNTWFNVEVRSVGNKTSIFVNGVSKLSGILQGQLHGGRIGLVTRSAAGKFDDVSWQEIK